jgi:hypothetical protein
LAATSDHVEHPTATALYYGYLVAASSLVGLYCHLRRPGSAFGPLLALFGVTTWVVSWQSSDWALAFDIGVLAEGVFFVLTFSLFLAFPSGRLRTLGNRLLIGVATVAALAFFVPWALLTPVIAGAGPLSGCRPSCPANVLQVASNPAAVEFFGRWETYAMLALVIATLGVYWKRVTTASRPQRRALIAVAASSLLFLPIFFIYHFSSPDPSRRPCDARTDGVGAGGHPRHHAAGVPRRPVSGGAVRRRGARAAPRTAHATSDAA